MLLDKESIDLVLVPSGLVTMFAYHLFLLYRILRLPHTTVIGYENHNKRAWVDRMLQGNAEETALALQVIASSMGASNDLASLSIALSSLIGAWIGSNSKLFISFVIYGDTSPTTASVKYISLLICFVVAFTCFMHSASHFLTVSFLMSTLDSDVPESYVKTSLIRGSNFWALGLRALYFATTLLMWIFGPIPMLACSLLMVVILHNLDTNSTPLHPFRFSSRKGLQRTVVKSPVSIQNNLNHLKKPPDFSSSRIVKSLPLPSESCTRMSY